MSAFSKTPPICFMYSAGDSASSLDNKWSLNPTRCNYWRLRFTEESRKLQFNTVLFLWGGERKQIRFSILIKEDFYMETLTNVLNKAESKSCEFSETRRKSVTSLDTVEEEKKLWETQWLLSRSTFHVILTVFTAVRSLSWCPVEMTSYCTARTILLVLPIRDTKAQNKLFILVLSSTNSHEQDLWGAPGGNFTPSDRNIYLVVRGHCDNLTVFDHYSRSLDTISHKCLIGQNDDVLYPKGHRSTFLWHQNVLQKHFSSHYSSHWSHRLSSGPVLRARYTTSCYTRQLDWLKRTSALLDACVLDDWRALCRHTKEGKSLNLNFSITNHSH